MTHLFSCYGRALGTSTCDVSSCRGLCLISPRKAGRKEGKQGFWWLGHTFGNLAGEHRPKGESMALGWHLSSAPPPTSCLFPHLWHRDVNSAKRCACCIQQVASKCWSSFPLHPSGAGRAPQGLWVKGSRVEMWEDRVLYQPRPLKSRSLPTPGAGPGDRPVSPRWNQRPRALQQVSLPTAASGWPPACTGYTELQPPPT